MKIIGLLCVLGIGLVDEAESISVHNAERLQDIGLKHEAKPTGNQGGYSIKVWTKGHQLQKQAP